MSYPTRLAALLLAVGAQGGAAQTSDPMVVSSDPDLAALVGELLPDLARRSGMELRAPVRVEERSREDLVRYLEHKLEEELPADEARAIVDAYALLGLVPRDFDMRAILMALYTEQVAGFYEPDSTALFVMDDQAEDDLRGLLLHELVHAVQDQSVDLDALTDPGLGSDRATAAQAAIEGHATLVMFEYLAEAQMGAPVDLSRIPGFVPLLRQSLNEARSQFAALGSAPRILQESLIFPYLEGAVFLLGRWGGGERVVPFGAGLPRSTEEILRGTAPEPYELILEVTGAELVRDDVLGRLELGILLEEHFGAEAGSIAEGWDGDRFALVERADGGRALVSYVVWENAAARDHFVRAVGSGLGRFGGPAAVEAVDVGGRAASRLSVGDLAGLSVRARHASGR